MDIIPEQQQARGESVEDLKRKSLSGIGALVKRQAVVRLLSFFANLALARLLVPQVFGVYAIVAFIVHFFSLFGDVGIGAALIQKKGEPSRDEVSSTFWLQQALVWAVVCLALAAAPLALKLYPSLPPYSVWLVRALALSFALSSLKTIPAILMERRLDFRSIALVDIAETLFFYGTALAFALAGFEVWSFIIAAIARSASGAAAIWLLSGWRPALVFKTEFFKGLLRFGLPYQGNTLLGFTREALTPLFVGVFCGPLGVGYVAWAKSLALAPLMLSEAFGRVAFPAFSRIQEDREMLGRAVERSIRCITMVMFPVTAVMLALGPEIISVLFTAKWLPALPAYYFYCTSPAAIGVVLPMTSAILSLGKSGLLLRLMVLLTLMEWGFGVPFILYFGFNGVAFSQPIIVSIFYFIYKRVLKSERVAVSLVKNTSWQFLAAAAAGLACRAAAGYVPESPVTLLLLSLFGLGIYAGLIFAGPAKLKTEFWEQARALAGRGN